MCTRTLTERQAKILAWIDQYAAEHNRRIPSYREIARAFGVRSPNGVKAHVDALERKGFLRRPYTDTVACRVVQIAKRRDGDRLLIRGEWYRFIPASQLEEPYACEDSTAEQPDDQR